MQDINDASGEEEVDEVDSIFVASCVFVLLFSGEDWSICEHRAKLIEIFWIAFRFDLQSANRIRNFGAAWGGEPIL